MRKVYYLLLVSCTIDDSFPCGSQKNACLVVLFCSFSSSKLVLIIIVGTAPCKCVPCIRRTGKQRGKIELHKIFSYGAHIIFIVHV